MNKAYKFRLYPNNEQKVFFEKTFGCVRFIYNKMLADKIDYYKQESKMLYNGYAQYKIKFPWLKEVDSRALANSQMNLKRAYENFFRNPSTGFPKFKSKKTSRKSYTTNFCNGNIKIVNNSIRLPKIGFVKAKISRQIPDDWKLKSVTISKTPTNKYYASVLFEYEVNIKPVEPVKVIGLDYSMSELFVDSEGGRADYPHFYKKALNKLAREQRKLSHCKIGSKNREKQRIRVALIHEKIANQRKDFLHKVSHQIANEWDAVCIETLDMREMAKELNFGKSVYDNGWGMFTGYLSYKLSDRGKQLVKIDKWFPSSKTCSNCGAIKKELLLSERVYHCDCGFTINRDLNAAINIRNEGIRMLA